MDLVRLGDVDVIVLSAVKDELSSIQGGKATLRKVPCNSCRTLPLRRAPAKFRYLSVE